MPGLNPLLQQSYNADGAIAAYRVVKHGTDDDHVAQASAATDAFVGVTGNLGADTAEDRVDIITHGFAPVDCGGTVTRGDRVTADANGKVIAVAADAGNVNVIGTAEMSGVVGDRIVINLLIGSELAYADLAGLMAQYAKLSNVLAQNDAVIHSGDGAVAISGVALITGGTGIAGLTLAAPTPGARCELRVRSLSSGTVVLTTAAGVTFDGTNNTATFDAANEGLILVYKSATQWEIVVNIGSAALSSV